MTSNKSTNSDYFRGEHIIREAVCLGVDMSGKSSKKLGDKIHMQRQYPHRGVSPGTSLLHSENLHMLEKIVGVS
jgi:hypothetical protein